MSTETEDVLAHYGIKGMKWGKRSSRSSSSSTPKEPAHSDAITAKAIRATGKTSGTDALSNTQLQTAITRMNLEQQYSRLSPTSTNRGKKLAADILQNTGKQVASEYAKTAAKKGIEAGIKGAMSLAKSRY